MAIGKKYIQGNLSYDVFAIIPFSLLIRINGGYERLFYILKLIRFNKGFQIFDASAFMSVMKKIYQSKMENIIKKDPLLAERMDIDNNNIS